MDFRVPDIKVVSPDRFCPDCRRQLLFVDGDTFMVAENTHAYMHSTVMYGDLAEIPDEIEAMPEVYCLRRLCRFKRWRRGEKIETPWDEEDKYLVELRKFRRATYALTVASLLLVGVAAFLAVTSIVDLII